MATEFSSLSSNGKSALHDRSSFVAADSHFHPQNAAPRDTDQGAGTACGAIPLHWDNGNATGAAWVYAPPLAASVSFIDRPTQSPAA